MTADARSDLPAAARLGVLGWPVAHSRSPAMQNAALQELGLTGWRYQLLPVPPEAFTETVRALGAAGLLGANVTIPHKEAALALATTATERATAIGAANTLTFDAASGTIHADNTDAPGFIAALPQRPVAGSTALVLGAGGSARAIVHALLEQDVIVEIWNRTPERAAALVRDLGGRAVDQAHPADLLVNCTAAGLEHASSVFEGLPLTADDLGTYATVVDLVYRPGGTEFLAAARSRGSTVVDGLQMLVQQGALSLEAWTGLPAPADVMLAAALRSSLPPTHELRSSPSATRRSPRN